MCEEKRSVEGTAQIENQSSSRRSLARRRIVRRSLNFEHSSLNYLVKILYATPKMPENSSSSSSRSKSHDCESADVEALHAPDGVPLLPGMAVSLIKDLKSQRILTRNAPSSTSFAMKPEPSSITLSTSSDETRPRISPSFSPWRLTDASFSPTSSTRTTRDGQPSAERAQSRRLPGEPLEKAVNPSPSISEFPTRSMWRLVGSERAITGWPRSES